MRAAGRRRPRRSRPASRRQYDRSCEAPTAGGRAQSTRAERSRGTVSSVPPIPGLDLLTHLDADIQAAAERALSPAVMSRARSDWARRRLRRRRRRSTSRTAPWSPPRAIRRYDPGLFVGGITAADLRRLTDEKAGAALRSRIIAETYPPASTFKVISVPAAVSAGASLKGTYDCTPELPDRQPRLQQLRVAWLRPDRPAPRPRRLLRHGVLPPRATTSWVDQGGLSAPVGPG